ncbi:MAG TPA: OFA family MFS transporter [Spirochaetota bacterium]|nr:OFA family MFS transporter [Spirochaetota bacterium]HPF07880.1 OFA family MFS transporter [Spirochaetota bacterium]HPJ43971.1 OFA family MFS transporter [Spirochaetota bacterium]HRX49395.1 OFA family MFS transporter [Spirochaetota bacterium]
MAEETRLFGMPAEKGRWIFVALGFFINICLGSVYAYSVFKNPVQKAFGCTATEGGLPFMIFLASFATMMFFGGRVLEKLGPKKLGIVGGVLVGLGWIVSKWTGNIYMLTLTYGLIGGGGVGLAYGGPIAVAARWFPDKKGLAVGLTLAGFGGSPFVSANVAKILIAQSGPFDAFFTLGVAFLIIVVLLSLPMKFPEAGWKPAGWAPAAGAAVAVEMDSAAMTKTSSFWGLFLCYIFGCLAGLMAIGISSPVAQEIVKIDAATAATLTGVFAIFNGVGRPIFGTLTDKLSPKKAAVINFVIILAASLGMLSAGEGSVTLYVICFVGFWLCLGGWLAIAPTATGTFFGMVNYAKNYGLVYFAYGIGAILGGIISGQAKDTFGSYTFAFYPTAALAVLGVILAVLFLKAPEQD